MSNASEAVDAIIEDLSDLGGLDHAWDSVSDEDREVIKDRWVGYVEERATAGTAQAELLRRMAVVSAAIEKSHSRSGEIFFDYVNHAGVQERRRVMVARLRVQPEGEAFYAGQWVIHGLCMSRGEIRDFLIDHVENVEAGT